MNFENTGFFECECVTSDSNWDAPVERKPVRPALEGSYKAIFHATEIPNFLLPLRGATWISGALNQEQLERAIGVIYLPVTKRMSHYFNARLANQFNALVHMDQTRAVEPLERTSRWEVGKFPETYPFAV